MLQHLLWGGELALVDTGSTVDSVKPLHRIHYISSKENPGSKPFPSQARPCLSYPKKYSNSFLPKRFLSQAFRLGSSLFSC